MKVAVGNYFGKDIIGILDEENKKIKDVFKIEDVIINEEGAWAPDLMFFRSLAFIYTGNFKDREKIDVELDDVKFIKTIDQIRVTQNDLATHLLSQYLKFTQENNPVRKEGEKTTNLIGL